MSWHGQNIPSRADLKTLSSGMRLGDRLDLGAETGKSVPALDLLLAGFSKPDDEGICVKRVSSDEGPGADEDSTILIDDDTLLDESDTIRRSSAADCGPSNGPEKNAKKRACANCTCGLADASDSAPKTSSCGSVSCLFAFACKMTNSSTVLPRGCIQMLRMSI